MVPIVDAVRGLLPLPTGAVADDTCAPPLKHQARTLYLWPVVESRTETGDLDLGSFTLRLEYCDAPGGEEATSARSRATSLALDGAADAMAGAVREHRHELSQPALWDDLQVTRISYDTVRTLDFRGFAMDLSGYRYVSS
jgi:hypothetical protein